MSSLENSIIHFANEAYPEVEHDEDLIKETIARIDFNRLVDLLDPEDEENLDILHDVFSDFDESGEIDENVINYINIIVTFAMLCKKAAMEEISESESSNHTETDSDSDDHPMEYESDESFAENLHLQDIESLDDEAFAKNLHLQDIEKETYRILAQEKAVSSWYESREKKYDDMILEHENKMRHLTKQLDNTKRQRAWKELKAEVARAQEKHLDLLSKWVEIDTITSTIEERLKK